MYRYSLRCSLWIAVSSFLLALRPVHADFGTGTITFDETSYIVYDSDGSVYSGVGAGIVGDAVDAPSNEFYQNSGGLTRVESGGSLSHYTLTMQDGAVIPYDAYFKSGDIYVRFAFDLSSGSSSGSIDSGDLSAVIERTYHSTKSELDGDVAAYTGTSDDKKDYVASGYETQAGDFFVRAFKNTDPVAAGDGTSTDTDFDHGNSTTGIKPSIGMRSSSNTRRPTVRRLIQQQAKSGILMVLRPTVQRGLA